MVTEPALLNEGLINEVWGDSLRTEFEDTVSKAALKLGLTKGGCLIVAHRLLPPSIDDAVYLPEIVSMFEAMRGEGYSSEDIIKDIIGGFGSFWDNTVVSYEMLFGNNTSGSLIAAATMAYNCHLAGKDMQTILTESPGLLLKGCYLDAGSAVSGDLVVAFHGSDPAINEYLARRALAETQEEMKRRLPRYVWFA